MGWESTNVTFNWNGSGTGPVARSHHRANRTRSGSKRSGTVPLRSHREVVGSFRNDRTQWNRCEHGRPVAFRNRSGPKAVVWTRPYINEEVRAGHMGINSRLRRARCSIFLSIKSADILHHVKNAPLSLL